jgi:hypothetical protein
MNCGSPPRSSAHPARDGLSALASSLPPDTVSTDSLAAILKANLAALPPATLKTLEPGLPAWLEALRSLQAARSTSGALTLRTRDAWLLCLNTAASAQVVRDSSLKDGPYYIDGIHAPELLRALFDIPFSATGAVPKLVLMTGSPAEALLGLSLADARDIVGSPRTSLWIGPDCHRRLEAEANVRIGCTLGWVIATPAPPFEHARWPRGEPGRVLARMGEEQHNLTRSARDRVLRWDRETASHRHQRLVQGVASRPRVLLPTTLYSTYLQHAAADIAAALHDLGCEAHVVQEPDKHSLLTTLAMLRAVESFQPDLILFINTLRSQLPDVPLPNTPTITWVQDAMRHLFEADDGNRPTNLDFLMGHLHERMVQRLGIPAHRTLATPVLASDRKFNPGPVGDADRERFACDVAYVSHQSETPEAFAERASLSGPADGASRRIIAEVAPVVIDMARASTIHTEQLLPALDRLATDTLRRHGGDAAIEQGHADLLHQLIHPIAERALRQQMIEWAADLCDERGWKLHLYGRGWEQHPRFARYAQGELPHGESLRAAYQCAKMHLHAGLGGAHHQRVLECGLSGGCTLVRIKADDLRLLEWWAQCDVGREVSRHNLVRAFPDRDDFWLTPIADHWQAMLVQNVYDRLGIPPQHDRTGKFAVHKDHLNGGCATVAPHPIPAGHPADCGFWSKESFSQQAEAVVTNPRAGAGSTAGQHAATCRGLPAGAAIDSHAYSGMMGSRPPKTCLARSTIARSCASEEIRIASTSRGQAGGVTTGHPSNSSRDGLSSTIART